MVANLDSELLTDLVKAAGSHRRAAAVLRRLAQALTVGAGTGSAGLNAWADRIEEMDEVRDPRAGDSVILRGKIAALPPGLGEALVCVHRPGEGSSGCISVQAGALEHDSAAVLYDGGVPG